MKEERELFPREKYLSNVRPFYKDTEMIKVITGVRRCGKSSLLLLIQKELFQSGVTESNIVSINLDKRPYKHIKDVEELEGVIDKCFAGVSGIKYLFIDEVQNVKGFEEVLNSYREERDYSIFITGSNSYLLSGELITKLTGRQKFWDLLEYKMDYVSMPKFIRISHPSFRIGEESLRNVERYRQNLINEFRFCLQKDMQKRYYESMGCSENEFESRYAQKINHFQQVEKEFMQSNGVQL